MLFLWCGDGWVWFGLVLCEYLVSEFMVVFGILIICVLVVVSMGEQVICEQLLFGVVLICVVFSYIWVGMFEFYVVWGDLDWLWFLVQYVMVWYYFDVKILVQFLQVVVDVQVVMIVGWMGLGFIYGVMNIDNMFVLGEMIDYGFCVFMDGYKFVQVFFLIDVGGCYVWNEQFNIVVWNLVQFVSCFVLLMGNDDVVVVEVMCIVYSFFEIYKVEGYCCFVVKLGISILCFEDQVLIDWFLDLMVVGWVDFICVFVGLLDGMVCDEFIDCDGYDLWVCDWQVCIQGLVDVFVVMVWVNLCCILCNYWIEQVIVVVCDDGDFMLFYWLDVVLCDFFIDCVEWDDLVQVLLVDEIVQCIFCGI